MKGVRFAPSPTGAFHLGNFRTAWISRELARALGEPWVVRFEDIDGPRVVAGAQERQLREMAELGLVPDETRVQSASHARHLETLTRAAREGRVYPCTCSRKEVQSALAGLASAPHSEPAQYSGHCREPLRRDAAKAAGRELAWRFVMDEGTDGKQDFIVARARARQGPGSEWEPEPDGFVPAYHWACAVDDLDGAYRLLVRASDLASAAVQQRAIQGWLARAEGRVPGVPAVFHTALVTQDDGHRLEKRTAGVTLPELLERGWTVERILARFAAGFQVPKAGVAAGEVLGEARERITLSELGFPSK